MLAAGHRERLASGRPDAEDAPPPGGYSHAVPRLAALPRSAAFLVISLVYLLAALAAWLVLHQLPAGTTLGGQLAAASLAGSLAVFAGSVALDNSSAFDAYWSVAPMATMPWLLARAPAPGARAWLATALVMAWGARLTWNWARQWRGLGHEDFRYVDIRQKTGLAYWPVSLLGIHLFPAILVWAGSLPLIPATQASRPLGLLDAAGALIAASAILLEAVADQQLRDFVVSPQPAGAICDQGLWSWSRHPNYLGEILFWWGLLLLGLSAEPTAWHLAAGAVAITLLFNVVSIPLHETRMAGRRPGFGAHRRRVSRLLLWPPRGGPGVAASPGQ